MRLKLISLVLGFSLALSNAFAGITEEGRGMLFGGDHAFFVKAVPGWVLDNQSGVNQGLHMVFYPKGESWANSPVIIYGRVVPKSKAHTVEDQIKQTVKDFHNNGSPDYVAERQQSLQLPNGKPVELCYFSGDKWGNYEAGAYFEERETINFLIFNARTKESYKKYLADFHEIALSYSNVYDAPSDNNRYDVKKLRIESEEHLKLVGGKEYESKAIRATGQQMANYMRDCTSYMPDSEMPSFELFIRINPDGTPVELYASPSNALSVCFKGLMSDNQYPSHDFDQYLLHIKMKITE